jgi:hypothetical protein
MPSASELQQRAVDYAKSGDFGPQALETNLELTKVAPANEGAWTRLSRCYLESGQLDEATAALDAVLQINPQNTIARSLQIEVTRRRSAAAAPVATPRSRAPRAPRSAAPAARPRTTRAPVVGGFGRAEFVTLGQLAPTAAVEALGGRVEALLMAINDGACAARAVEARNRAGLSGARLFRRNTLRAPGPGHLRAFHQSVAWEPQLTVQFFSATPWGRDAMAVGVGFNAGSAADGESDAVGEQHRQERLLATFAQFQQLLGGAWRSFLAQWMSGSGGFVQLGERPPATDLLPQAGLSALISAGDLRELGWAFVGRWLFADRANDAEILADGRRLITWSESSFADLLPLWSSLYR